MFIWLLISFILTIFYIGIMLTYKNEWNELKETRELSDQVSTFVSIIIPARNEAATIAGILYDITQLDYPIELLEVIVIDDHSEDNTFEVAAKFSNKHTHINVLRLEEIIQEPTSAYKKRAIESAVQLAKGKLIVTTDADCRVQKNWVRSIVSRYEKEELKLIAAPVCFYRDKNNFERFQTLDFCGMQAITGASLSIGMFNMANGANLAYEKEAFLQVNGYQDIDHKASGDDMLLVYKIAQRFPEKVTFLKDRQAVVYTPPMHSISDFLQQRFRWTSKSTSYQDKRITAILGMVYLFVLSIWINAGYFFFQSIYSIIFPDPTLIALLNFLPVFLILILLVFQVAAKSLTDYFFLKSAAAFFKRQDLMRTFLISELWHIWYIPYVGTLGNILKYQWKGRKLK